MRIHESPLGQAPPSPVLEDYGLQTARRDPGAVPRAAQRKSVHEEGPALQGHPYNDQNLVHQVRDLWRSCNALHYQQKQFDNAVQEHLRVAYGQVEISAALASSRIEEQMTSRFRDIEKNVRLISVMHCEDCYPKLLPSQLRHSKASDTLRFNKLRRDDAESRSRSRGSLPVMK